MGDVFEQASWRQMGIYGNVFVRRFQMYIGQMMPGHTHNYDHATILVRGRVRLKLVYPDGKAQERWHDAPAIFEVPAQCKHEFQCESNQAEIWCTFAVRDKDGEIAEFVREEHLEVKDYAE